jgi:glycine cleavage system H protein
MAGLKYTKSHEWARIEDGIATVGISDYAQEQLGDVVYVELPDKGRQVEASGEIAVVESVKAASEVYAPVSGEVIEVNGALPDDPALINRSPTGDAWFLKLKLSNPAEADSLMDEAAYAAYVETLH